MDNSRNSWFGECRAYQKPVKNPSPGAIRDYEEEWEEAFQRKSGHWSHREG